MLQSLTSNLTQKAANVTNQPGSMFNSIGQLSTSFPNSIKPMNQLMNQFHSGPFASIVSGVSGGGGSNIAANQRSGPGQPATSTQSHHSPMVWLQIGNL